MYNELVAHYTKSTEASLNLTQLSMQRKQGTSASFILNFQDKVCKYEKMADKNDPFSDGWKMILLQNDVHPIAELCQVKLTLLTRTRSALVPISLLMHISNLCTVRTVINYDAQFQFKKGPHQAMFAHDLVEYDDQGTIMYKDGYDIDTTLDVVLAHIASQQAAKVCIPGPKGYELSSDTQDIWWSLPESNMAIILGWSCKCSHQHTMLIQSSLAYSHATF
jgi:hypothetical protein